MAAAYIMMTCLIFGATVVDNVWIRSIFMLALLTWLAPLVLPL